jgi:hypothetical protein
MTDEKKPKRPIGPFSFCPRHNVFYQSCGCVWEKKGRTKKDESEDIET